MMINRFRDHINEDILRHNTMTLYELEKSICYSDFDKSSRFCMEMLEKAGFTDVERQSVKSDGLHAVMDCIMPEAWDLTGHSFLKITDPDIPKEWQTLADTDEQPLSVMTWSGSTPPEGIRCEIIDGTGLDLFNPGDSVRGKFVLCNQPKTCYYELAMAGALGAVFYNADVAETYPDEIRWMNGQGRIGWYHAKEDPRLPFFSISPRRGEYLRALLQKRKVHIHALVQSRTYDGEIYTITGRIPGESDEEIAILAHIYEPFPADDACGAAGAVEIGRILKQMTAEGTLPSLKRSYRVILAMERYGFADYFSDPTRSGKVLCALNLDCLGHLTYRDAGIPLVSRRSTVSLPFFGELLIDELIARHDPTLKYTSMPGSLSDDTFCSEPLVNVPTNWLKTESPGFHHNTGKMFHEVDWELTRRMLTVEGGYAAILLTAGEKEFRELLPVIERRALEDFQREVSTRTDSFEINSLIDYHAGRVLSLNRFVPGLVDEISIREQFQRFSPQAVDRTVSLSAAEQEASRIIPDRGDSWLPFSLARVPYTERKVFRDNAVDFTGFSLFDGKRSLLEALKLRKFFLNEPLNDEIIFRSIDYLYYLEQYGYVNIEKADKS